ncbi:uncharacterized protein ACJ7VT_004964 [Polymixia lowei]
MVVSSANFRMTLELRVATSVEQQKRRISDLMAMCQQKDDVISDLQSAVDRSPNHKPNPVHRPDIAPHGGDLERVVQSVRQECDCLKKGEEEEDRRRKRGADTLEFGGEPAKKRVVWEEDSKNETISQLRAEREERRRLEDELRRREGEMEALKEECVCLERRVESLTADVEQQGSDCECLMSSLESEQKETSRLQKENKALVNGMFVLQNTVQSNSSEVTSLQSQLREETDRVKSLSEQLDIAKAHLQTLEDKSEEKTKTIECLIQEANGLRKEIKEEQEEGRTRAFHTALEQLKKESEEALERSAQKSQQIEHLQREIAHLTSLLTDSEGVSVELREELANQKEASSRQLHTWQKEKGLLMQQTEGLLMQQKASCTMETMLKQQLAESEAQCAALQERLEEMERAEERKRENEKQEVSGLKSREDEERTVPVVEELREEIQRFQERREKEGRMAEEERRSRAFEAVKREMEKLRKLRNEEEEEEEHLSLQTTQVIIERRKGETVPMTTRRKRKSTDTEELVNRENKRNRLRGTRANKQSPSVLCSSVVKEKRDGTLQRIGDLLHNSPSILGSKAKTIMGLVNSRSVEKEAVPMTTKAKPKRSRRKLYKTDVSSPLNLSSHAMMGGAEEEKKESDHIILKRQLRSKPSRK